MLSILDNSTNFSALSVKDLLTARDRYHDLLISKKNVIATAIGLYRIRRSDRQDDRSNREGALYLGTIWEAAWKQGGGDSKIGTGSVLKEIDMRKLYEIETFLKSVSLDKYSLM